MNSLSSRTLPLSLPARIKVGGSLALAGLSLLMLVGFVQGANEVVHNAAHDTRHAFTFPCH